LMSCSSAFSSALLSPPSWRSGKQQILWWLFFISIVWSHLYYWRDYVYTCVWLTVVQTGRKSSPRLPADQARCLAIFSMFICFIHSMFVFPTRLQWKETPSPSPNNQTSRVVLKSNFLKFN
jgi:hypothetical protein